MLKTSSFLKLLINNKKKIDKLKVVKKLAAMLKGQPQKLAYLYKESHVESPATIKKTNTTLLNLTFLNVISPPTKDFKSQANKAIKVSSTNSACLLNSKTLDVYGKNHKGIKNTIRYKETFIILSKFLFIFCFLN